ncbi:Type III secretion ATP synthase HrcN [compost metagenome]
MSQITGKKHQQAARTLKQLYADYQAIKPLIPLGGYVAGADAQADRAVRLSPAITQYLCQDVEHCAAIPQCINELEALSRA